MLIKIQREPSTPVSTPGRLIINEKFYCFTLEDVVRIGPKVPGKTAIPAGAYKLILDYSNKFKRRMPHILDVPGFSGIRIHKGNTSEDTEGCILVGASQGKDRVYACSWVYDNLMSRLETAESIQEEVIVSVLDAPKEAIQ